MKQRGEYVSRAANKAFFGWPDTYQPELLKNHAPNGPDFRHALLANFFDPVHKR
jgi:hypothetical protein